MGRKKSDGTGIDRICTMAAMRIDHWPRSPYVVGGPNSGLMSDAWVDAEIMQVLVRFGIDRWAVTAPDIAQDLGIPGTRIAGRLKSLAHRDLARKATDDDAVVGVYEDEYYRSGHPPKGQAWTIGKLARSRVTKCRKGRQNGSTKSYEQRIKEQSNA